MMSGYSFIPDYINRPDMYILILARRQKKRKGNRLCRAVCTVLAVSHLVLLGWI
jgi:hypothetical protein